MNDDVHDRPTVDELVTAVREWLEDVAAGEADANRFHTRVAANMLAMVERQLALDDELVARHRQRLALLGVSSQGELAARIRDGGYDDSLDDVRAVVLANVVDKLRVANPNYLNAHVESGRIDAE